MGTTLLQETLHHGPWLMNRVNRARGGSRRGGLDPGGGGKNLGTKDEERVWDWWTGQGVLVSRVRSPLGMGFRGRSLEGYGAQG